MFKHALYHISKALPDVALSGLLLFFYLSGNYQNYSPVVQTLALKATLVSLGFLHSHILQGIMFPEIDWRKDNVDTIEKIRSTALYMVFIYAYCMGG